MQSYDVTEIIAVTNLYAMAVDTQRWHLFDRVFVADAEVDFGGNFRWQSLEALKRDFETVHAGFSSTLHITTNHQVLVQQDHANCLSYVHGRFFCDTDEGRIQTQSGGWYDDVLVRQGGAWRIQTRTCRVVWTEESPLAAVPPQPYSLRSEARSDRLKFLRALEGQ